MIKRAHEAPISIFHDVQKVTDIDYALVHLFEESTEYYNLFIQALANGREVILDNSIFELGEAFDEKKYVGWINRLNPTWYIVPDSLEDSQKTANNAAAWFYDYPVIVPSKPIVVAQGKSYVDMCNCYNMLQNITGHVEECMIGISFDYSFFEHWFPNEPTVYHRWMKGRARLLERMVEDGVIDTSRKHHLLGSGLPQEGMLFNYASKYPWIYSMDTSNPVVHGLKGIRYDGGLQNKESTKLFTLINSQVNEVQLENIMYNIRLFKMYWSF